MKQSCDVLLLEDDPCTRADFSLLLESNDYRVRQASTIALARQQLSCERFVVIVADLKLPDGNSMELLRGLRGQNDLTPFLFVTGFASIDVLIEALRLGASDFIEKPLLDDELVECVDKLAARNSKPDKRSNDDPRITDALNLIESDLSIAGSTRKLAAQVGMQESRFRHLFRAQVGCSVTASRNKARLAHARWLLTTTALRVSEIAYSVGFSDQKHFSKAFRADAGMSPRSYRRDGASLQ